MNRQESLPETTRGNSKRTLSLQDMAGRKKQPRNELPQNTMMPLPQLFMMEAISNKLNGENASECLLQLARVFREQSELCLQQAERLDRMAAAQVDDPQGRPASREYLAMRLQRQNVMTLVDKSADIMIESQKMLDSIESRLVPFRQKTVNPVKSKRKGGGMTPYTVFYKENYASFANRLGITTAKVLAPEIGKAWRALSKEEKDAYLEKAREINRERVEKGDAPTSEKILPNEIQ